MPVQILFSDLGRPLIDPLTCSWEAAAPVLDRIREKLNEIVAASPLWDRRIANVQVADAKEATILVRGLVSAKNAGTLGDLRNEVREKLRQMGLNLRGD